MGVGQGQGQNSGANCIRFKARLALWRSCTYKVKLTNMHAWSSAREELVP
jgi:hypothetical protein